MVPWRTVAIAYALLGSIASAFAVGLCGSSPLVHPSPWLALDDNLRIGSSLVLGVAFAGVIVASTRVTVRQFAWARALHSELRPVARNLGGGGILVIAVLSSLGEELFFRGLLAPLCGVIAQGVLFGLAHQLRGSSRWIWIAWATVVGVALGAMFALTGSLLGPIVAHAGINAANLAFLRDHDPAPRERRLGGLLAPFDA